MPYAIGGPLDLQINPGEVQGEQGLIRMIALMKSFIDLGGLMLTMTGVDRETMQHLRMWNWHWIPQEEDV